MAFLFTWDAAFEAIPADGNDASEGATRIRNHKVAVSERMKIDHSWDGDADDGEHTKITFTDPLASDPANVAEKGFLYTKDVSAKVELFWEDEDGNVKQLTSAGTILFGPSQVMESTVADAAAGPSLELYRNSASPAAADFIGSYPFTGESDTGVKVTFAELLAQIIDPTNAAEDARLILRTMVAGALTDILTVGPGLQVGAPTGADQGAGSINAVTLYDDGVQLDKASQAEMEAASSDTVDAIATAGGMHHHPGVAKAWINFDGTGTPTINASYNVDSITDLGAGHFRINFITDMSSVDYVVVSADGNVSNAVTALAISNLLVGSFEITSRVNTSGTVTDFSAYHLVVYGDQ